MNKRMITFYMKVAFLCSELSRAKRLQVGCVIVKNNNIISFSWNGTPAGWTNECEYKKYMPETSGERLDPDEIQKQWPLEDYKGKYKLVTKPEVLHAEMNALMKLARCTESGDKAILFTTHQPCLECAKGIYQSGIKEVYYTHSYRTKDGIEFLCKCDINIEQISDLLEE